MLRATFSSMPRWMQVYIVPAAVGCLIGIAAYLAYGFYADARDRTASQLFTQLENAVQASDSESVNETLEQIAEQATSDQHAAAMLLAAKHQANEGNYEDAVQSYDFVIANSSLAAVRDMARLRKSSVLVRQGQTDEVSSILADIESSAANTNLSVARDIATGDYQTAAGELDEALQSYEQAAEVLQQNNQTALLEILRIKIALLSSAKLRELRAKQG